MNLQCVSHASAINLVENQHQFFNGCKLHMLNSILEQFDQHPRRVFAALGLVCTGLLCFAMYLQQVGGLEPCPMCIVQRYADTLVVLFALVGALSARRAMHWFAGLTLILSTVGGAFVAARQSWLQWYPPEVVSCGRDLYGMIENFPLKRVLPMIFKGSGDCSKVDWTFLGGSIANWSFLWFCAAFICVSFLLWRQQRRG